MDDNELLWGAIESNFECDYMMGGGSDSIPAPLFSYKERKISYNQKDSDPRGCCWYGVMTCIANNWGIDRTEEDFQYMRDTAPSYGRVNHAGMYLSRAGDMVVDYLNKKHPDQHWVKMAVAIGDSVSYMKNGYMVQFGSKVNLKYRYDINDGLISAPWGTDGYGHCRSLAGLTAQNEDWTAIVENYNGVYPHNTIDIWDYAKLLEAKQLFPQSFIYYPTEPMTQELPPHMTVDQANAIEKAYPDLFTPNFSESVTAWIAAASTGKMKFLYTNYLGMDGVMKMMNDLAFYRNK